MRDEKSPFLVNRTKLHRPPLPSDLVSRPRLLTRLEGWRRLALTLVCAPAGYGKSTFIANWLATCDCPSAWISLDENDNDPRILLTYILEAMQTIVPGACSGIRDVLKSDILPSSHILAATLGDNLDHIDKELILVLDDYHVVHEKAVHDVIAELLLHIPREVHLVLGTRHDPPFPLSSMRARNQLAEIRVQDLSFTRQETVEFLQNVLDIGIDSDLAVAFEDKSEGWAAGLRLMAATLRRRKDPRELLAGLERDHRHVVEFLVDQVLADQPANVQAFLLDTSILDRFCGPLCDALHPSSGAVQELDGEGFVAIAERANLFLIPLDEEFRWFRYHHLFQNLLRRRLKRRKSAGEIADLHARASAWLAGEGLIEEALHHALQSVAREQAAILVNDHRQDFMNAEQWHRLRSWLHALPRDIIDGDPGLLMLEAWTWLGFPEMAGFVEQAGKLLAEMPDSTPHKQSLQGELNTLRSLVHFHVADGERAVAFAQSALEELPVDRASIRAMAVIVLSMGYQMIGHLERAHAVVHEALGSEEADRETYHSRVLATSCFVEYIAANLVDVRQSADRLLDLGRESVLPESTAHAHYFLGLCHYDRNELDDAEKHIAAVVKAPYVVNVHNHSYSAFALALTYEATGRSNDAREVVDAVADLAMTARNASLVQIAQAFRAELAIRQGRIAEAVQWARTFDPHPFFVAYRFFMPQLTLAKVLIAQDTAGTREEAARLLSESNDFFSGIHNMRLVIEIVALQALLYDAGGDEAAALSALDCAVSAAEPGGFVRLFVDLGPRMAGLLDRLVRRNKKSGLAGRILAAFRDERSAEMGADQALAGDLSRREREILSLMVGRLSNREIATQLIISQETVKRHAANIYQKLHVNSRQEAVTRARTLGYLPRK